MLFCRTIRNNNAIVTTTDGRCRGKFTTCDVTVTFTFAESYLLATYLPCRSRRRGHCRPERADVYASLATTYIFIPLAFETLDPIISMGVVFLIILVNVQRLVPATYENLFSV